MAEVDERVRAWSVKTIEGLMDGSNSILQKKTRLALHARSRGNLPWEQEERRSRRD